MFSILVISERVLFRREHDAGCYVTSAYFVSKLLVDIVPFRVLPSFVFGSVVYFIVGLKANALNFIWFQIILMMRKALHA